jgi:hypothetical protein
MLRLIVNKRFDPFGPVISCLSITPEASVMVPSGKASAVLTPVALGCGEPYLKIG